MTVTVDYTGDGSPDIIYNVADSSAFLNSTIEEVRSRGQEVYDNLTELENSAESVAQTALESVRRLREFSAAVGTVTFNPPAASFSEFGGVETSEMAINTPTPNPFAVNAQFDYELAEPIDNPSIDKPQPSTYNDVPAPTLSTNVAPPRSPGSYTSPSVTAPPVNIGEFNPDTVEAPVLDDIDNIDLTPIDVAPFPDLTIDTSDLEALIDRLEGTPNDLDPLPPYVYLLPEVFDVVGGFCEGELVIQIDELIAPYISQSASLLTSLRATVSSSIGKRGLTSVSNINALDTSRDIYLKYLQGNSEKIFEYRVTEQCITEGYKLATAAHRLLVDIAIGMYNVEWARLKAIAQGNLDLALALINAYNAQVLIIQTQLAAYKGEAAQKKAEAQAFQVEAEQVELVGEINKLEGQNFAVQEQAKRTEADAYAAEVQGEKAKLDAYAAVVQGYEAEVIEARNKLLEYQTVTQTFLAEVQRATSEYEVYSAGAQSVGAQNAAKAANVSGQQAEIRAVAAEVTNMSAAAAAEAAKLSAQAAERRIEYQTAAVNNQTEGLNLTIIGSEYNKEVTDYVNNLAVEGAFLSSQSAIGGALSNYIDRAQRAAGRAASLSQTANEQLARVYASVYEAAGRAGASIATGKLSGYRSTVTLSAGDSLSGSNSYNVSVGTSGTNAYSEADNVTRSIEA